MFCRRNVKRPVIDIAIPYYIVVDPPPSECVIEEGAGQQTTQMNQLQKVRLVFSCLFFRRHNSIRLRGRADARLFFALWVYVSFRDSVGLDTKSHNAQPRAVVDPRFSMLDPVFALRR